MIVAFVSMDKFLETRNRKNKGAISSRTVVLKCATSDEDLGVAFFVRDGAWLHGSLSHVKSRLGMWHCVRITVTASVA